MFCGIDGSGKSTLIDNIRDRIDIPLLKMMTRRSWFDSGDIEIASEVFNDLIKQLAKQRVNVLLDRGFVSSIVYSKVYNRKYNLEYIYDMIYEISSQLKIIYCYTDDVKTSISRKGIDKFINTRYFLKLQIEYHNIIEHIHKKYGVDVCMINTSELSKEEASKSATEFIKRHK